MNVGLSFSGAVISPGHKLPLFLNGLTLLIFSSMIPHFFSQVGIWHYSRSHSTKHKDAEQRLFKQLLMVRPLFNLDLPACCFGFLFFGNIDL